MGAGPAHEALRDLTRAREDHGFQVKAAAGVGIPAEPWPALRQARKMDAGAFELVRA